MPRLAIMNDKLEIHGPASDAERFNQFITGRLAAAGDRNVAIFTHATPDPDAIGAMRGIQYLLQVIHGVEADCFYDGEVSHPQNKATVQLLDAQLRRVETYNPEEYFCNILVDTIPANAGLGRREVKFDVVIDHHKEHPNGSFNGLLIHHHTGSACGIVYEMMKDSDLKFQDGDLEHSKIATAILVGALTDTDNWMSVDTSRRDFKVREDLFPLHDPDALRKIVNFNRPMSWIKLMGVAINEVEIDEGVAVVGLGCLNEEQRDVIADIASSMLTWGNVQTAVVFALFGGERIEASVRTNNDAVEIHALCKQLGGKLGSGGGKSCKGGYKKFLGDVAMDIEEDDLLKAEMWEVIKKREIAKIFKVMKK